MSQRSFLGLSVYLLDASCIIRLDGMDKVPLSPPEFTPAQRVIIWDGLERLAAEGRLKVIRLVESEIFAWHPEGLEHLDQFVNHKLDLRRTRELVNDYRYITQNYPHIAPKAGRDPADPWLIVLARKYGFTILTQELSRSDRNVKSLKAKNRIKIADVCDMEGLLRLDLRKLAAAEGWALP